MEGGPAWEPFPGGAASGFSSFSFWKPDGPSSGAGALNGSVPGGRSGPPPMGSGLRSALPAWPPAQNLAVG